MKILSYNCSPIIYNKIRLTLLLFLFNWLDCFFTEKWLTNGGEEGNVLAEKIINEFGFGWLFGLKSIMILGLFVLIGEKLNWLKFITAAYGVLTIYHLFLLTQH